MRLKLLVVSAFVLSAGVLLQQVSNAADPEANQTVNATITPLVISMSLSGTTFAYGTQQAGVGEVVPTPEFITITNNGSVAEDFKITGFTSTSGDWLLGTTAGTDQFVHLFSTNNSAFTAMNGSLQTLQSNVSPTTGNFTLYTRLIVPSTITETEAQTLPIKITAVKHQ